MNLFFLACSFLEWNYVILVYNQKTTISLGCHFVLGDGFDCSSDESIEREKNVFFFALAINRTKGPNHFLILLE